MHLHVSMFTPVEQEKMAVLVPGLLEGAAVLLGDRGLLRVDDGGSRHDDGSTVSWCRLIKEREKANKKRKKLDKFWFILNLCVVKFPPKDIHLFDEISECT